MFCCCFYLLFVCLVKVIFFTDFTMVIHMFSPPVGELSLIFFEASNMQIQAYVENFEVDGCFFLTI